jgi:hypothetical protein
MGTAIEIAGAVSQGMVIWERMMKAADASDMAEYMEAMR